MATYELLVIKGPDEGQVYLLKAKEVLIGRDPTCELCFEDRTLSRQHAKILIQGDTLTVQDLGSVNGVLVNGVKITSAELKTNDRLTLGNIELHLQPATNETPSIKKLSPSVQINDEPTLLQQPGGQQIVQPESKSIMSITQTLSSSMLMDLLGRSHQSLGAMYRVTRIASSIFDLDVLLNKVLDETFATIRAERGFVLLIDPNTDQLELKASRWQKKEGLDQSVSISQNIISHVLTVVAFECVLFFPSSGKVVLFGHWRRRCLLASASSS
jgi:adenylate cyclase